MGFVTCGKLNDVKNELQSQTADAVKQAQDAEQKANDLAGELDNLKQGVQANERQSRENERQSRENATAINELKQKADDNAQGITTINGNVADIQRELGEVKAAQEPLEQKDMELDAAIADVLAMAESNRETNNSLTGKLNGILDSNSLLNENVNALSEQFDSLQPLVNDIDSDVRVLKAKSNIYLNDIQSLKETTHQIDERVVVLESGKGFQYQLNELRGSQTEDHREINNLKSRLDDQTVYVSNNTDRVRDLQDKYSSIKYTVDNLPQNLYEGMFTENGTLNSNGVNIIVVDDGNDEHGKEIHTYSEFNHPHFPAIIEDTLDIHTHLEPNAPVRFFGLFYEKLLIPGGDPVIYQRLIDNIKDGVYRTLDLPKMPMGDNGTYMSWSSAANIRYVPLDNDGNVITKDTPLDNIDKSLSLAMVDAIGDKGLNLAIIPVMLLRLKQLEEKVKQLESR